jgi:hypothetical protein
MALAEVITQESTAELPDSPELLMRAIAGKGRMVTFKVKRAGPRHDGGDAPKPWLH